MKMPQKKVQHSRKKAEMGGLFSNKYLWILIGLATGFIVTRLFIIFIYPVTGSVYINGFHFHHLYMGLILSFSAFLIVYLFQRQHISNLKSILFLCFILGLGLGMTLEDVFAHFIEGTDPWEWFKL
jgi:uncharacterized membrane protein